MGDFSPSWIYSLTNQDIESCQRTSLILSLVIQPDPRYRPKHKPYSIHWPLLSRQAKDESRFVTATELPAKARNLGFLDQRLALDWVQRNIVSVQFTSEMKSTDVWRMCLVETQTKVTHSGNRHDMTSWRELVTIFGESAGGLSVDVLLTSYGRNDRPPFSGTILQSGQVSYRGVSRLLIWWLFKLIRQDFKQTTSICGYVEHIGKRTGLQHHWHSFMPPKLRYHSFSD
jgi:hypothetical protein